MKLIKKLFGLIILVLVLAIVGVVSLVVLMFDETNNTSEDIINNPKDLNALVNDYVADALVDTATTDKVTLLLDELETNYLLYAIKDKISLPLVNLKSMYSTYVDDDTVSFSVPISLMGYSTVIKGNIDINVTNAGDIKFSLNSISIGKITSTNSVLKFIIKKAINVDTITESLKDSGINASITYDNGTYTLSMSKEEIEKTISGLMEGDNTNYLLNAIIETVIGDESLFNFKFNDDDKIGAVIDLTNLSYTETLKYDLYSGTNNINTLKVKLKTLFDAKIIDYENLSTVFDYLVRGYDVLSDEAKDVIDKLNLSSIGISDKTTYTGIVYKSALTMAKVFLDAVSFDLSNIANILLKGYYDITISESNLNEVLNGLDFIGTSFAFINEEGDVANITISSLYAELKDANLSLYLVLDVNGKYINARVDASVSENTDALLKLNVNDIKLGSKAINDKTKTYLLKYLESVLTGVEFLSVNASTNTLVLDFTSYIEDSSFEFLGNNGFTKKSLTMSSAHDGELILRFSK